MKMNIFQGVVHSISVACFRSRRAAARESCYLWVLGIANPKAPGMLKLKTKSDQCNERAAVLKALPELPMDYKL